MRTDKIFTLEKFKEHYRWRPIEELHEDFGPCVLINLIEDPCYLVIGSNLNVDYDESQWTHFTQITPLWTEDAKDMIKEINDKRSINKNF